MYGGDGYKTMMATVELLIYNGQAMTMTITDLEVR